MCISHCPVCVREFGHHGNSLNSCFLNHSWTSFAFWHGTLSCTAIREYHCPEEMHLVCSNVYAGVHITSTGIPGPKTSQQNIAQSTTLPLSACLLPIVHPGAITSPGQQCTGTQLSTWCKRKHNSSDQPTFFYHSMVLWAVDRGQHQRLDWSVATQLHTQQAVTHYCVLWHPSIIGSIRFLSNLSSSSVNHCRHAGFY